MPCILPLHYVILHPNLLLLNLVCLRYNFGFMVLNSDKLHAILFGTAERAHSVSSLHKTIDVAVAGSTTLLASCIKHHFRYNTHTCTMCTPANFEGQLWTNCSLLVPYTPFSKGKADG